ncbi:MAG: hypothetical protein N2652_04745 [Kiritimatiellae bacterium]|nr:hypothetical protein [Kiritimatiellia bacterium]
MSAGAHVRRHRFALKLAVTIPALVRAEPLPAMLATLAHDELREISGLAASRRRPDVIWAINDSGNPPMLYAAGTNGSVLARIEVAPARNDDWEDLAAFRHDGHPWLLIADCGDNLGQRPHITLWTVPEPHCGPGAATVAVTPALELQVRFPDGPRDVEAVAVDEATAEVLLLSKRDVPPRLYTVPLPAGPWTGQIAVATARPLAKLQTWPGPAGVLEHGVTGLLGAQPTAMDFDPVHRRLLILTYTDAWLWTAPQNEDWSSICTAVWRRVSLPDPRSGWLRRREAIAWTTDGDAALLTTEGRNPPLVRLEFPSDEIRAAASRDPR